MQPASLLTSGSQPRSASSVGRTSLLTTDDDFSPSGRRIASPKPFAPTASLVQPDNVYKSTSRRRSSSSSSYSSSTESDQPPAIPQQPPSALEVEYQELLSARVKADGDLLTLWAQITDLMEDIVAAAALSLPAEHQEALDAQREEVIKLTPQIMAGVHETLGMTSDPAMQSTPRSGNLLTPRGSPMDAHKLPSSKYLDLVDAFRDDVQLLCKHYSESLSVRFKRKEAQLKEVQLANKGLRSQVRKLAGLGVRKAEQVDQAKAHCEDVKKQLVGLLMQVGSASVNAIERQQAEIVPPLLSETGVNEDIVLARHARNAEKSYRELCSLLEFVKSQESHERRQNRWGTAIANRYYPEAYPEALNERLREVQKKRQDMLDEISNLEAFHVNVCLEENKSLHRKVTRSVSPVRPQFRHSSASRQNSPRPTRSVSPSVLSDAWTDTQPLPSADPPPPDTARTVTTSVASRSTSRREAVYRSNGMMHVPTSESALALNIIPRQANCTNTRTISGEMLPSLRTLMARKARLEQDLKRVQDQARLELKAQLRLLERAQEEATRRAAIEKRRREALVRER